MIKPLQDLVIIETARPPEESKGGVLLPDVVRDAEIRLVGIVRAVGPGKRRKKDGQHVPIAVKEGDRVYIERFTGMEAPTMGPEFLLVREKNIALILPPKGCNLGEEQND